MRDDNGVRVRGRLPRMLVSGWDIQICTTNKRAAAGETEEAGTDWNPPIQRSLATPPSREWGKDMDKEAGVGAKAS